MALPQGHGSGVCTRPGVHPDGGDSPVSVRRKSYCIPGGFGKAREEREGPGRNEGSPPAGALVLGF